MSRKNKMLNNEEMNFISFVAGFVEEPNYRKYSSAVDYCDKKREVDICLIQ